MTKTPQLPGVRMVTAKGRTYWYAWAGPGAPRLPDPRTDPQGHVAAYAKAMALRAATPARVTTVGDLAALYQASREWAALAASTRRVRTTYLARVVTDWGDKPARLLSQPGITAAVRRWRDRMADRPRAADYAVETLTVLSSWAARYGHIVKSEVAGIERLHWSDRSAIIWEPDELTRLLAQCSPALAALVTVAAYTGLRAGDLVGLTWAQVDLSAGVIERPTNKSRGRQRALVPMLPQVRAVLERLPRRGPQVFWTRKLGPWTSAGLASTFRDAAARAGVDKRFHDLRGTAATLYAQAGLSAAEIAPILGWEERTVQAIVRRYVSRAAWASVIVEKVRRKPTE